MQNRYPGQCMECRRQLAPFEGQAVRSEDRWKVVCLPGECRSEEEMIGRDMGDPSYFCEGCRHWTRGLGANLRDMDVWGECSLPRARSFDYVNDETYFTKEDDDCEFIAAKKPAS